ncbi:7-carboxy-7-deazaguanine synthase QueE [bacterium]|nr:7-carboxy-7-deazaguanine synthase QueE [Akkermansiaceae bacterium]MDB4405576.1 7-carboxy-7-deazaguanine synthase QueE [bacterium]MDB4449603.1 7-carboxy-7-deazaguanine synthase QueE [Akkermansiaceae bacterium]
MKVSRLADGSPEIFHTLQGEGASLGFPAVFLRLSLCNLHCHWCDTPYTWNWEQTPWTHQDGVKFSKTKEIVELSPAEIAPHILSYDCNRLVLTGGEPLLQQDELVKLTRLLPEIAFIEVETNGTKLPSDDFIAIPTQFNVSPKLSNSGIDEKLRLNFKALGLFASLEKAFFKFVVCNQSDLDEIKTLHSKLNLSPDRIHLMPEGRDAETLQHRSLWLADICRDQGYHFSPRLHVLLWGNERAK